MRLRRQLNLAIYPFVALVILVGCGRAKTFDAVNVAQKRPALVSVMHAPLPFVAADEAIAFSRWLAGVQLHAILVYAEATRDAVASRPPAPTARVASVVNNTLGNCGGDLPPCFVKQRESGGDYNAYNPTGCGGAGCFGAFQFSGAWAGKLGLPDDLSTATPEQQDAAARELWANGAGCSHWAAC